MAELETAAPVPGLRDTGSGGNRVSYESSGASRLTIKAEQKPGHFILMYQLDGDDNLVGDWPQLAQTPEVQRLPPRLLADRYLRASLSLPSRMMPHYWTCRNALRGMEMIWIHGMLHDVHLILQIGVTGWHGRLPCLLLLLVWRAHPSTLWGCLVGFRRQPTTLQC